ncbi:hypothetical protein HK097_002008 [Rhizophlyctis rosea]|uniref:Serine aminopeptidase S33 domain-containing protein n=1 Tax=Rhizophlyctis rosea TaxID=64517 RepID=A0AAD5S5V3_9FUNG|nr:hypothetical protein HK097_002008 [Rhizophlyctis rosea]
MLSSSAPQTFTSEEVTFPTYSPDEPSSPAWTLAGTLLLPTEQTSTKRYPAVLMIAGSGPVNRDGNITSGLVRINLNLYNRLAEHLTSQGGVATLRYDKRGAGKSLIPGDSNAFDRAGLFDFAHDALGAYAFLTTQPSIDPTKILILGHSEGSIIIPALASLLLSSTPTLPNPHGFLFLSGVAEHLPEATARQRRLIRDEVNTMSGIKGWLARKAATEERVEGQAKKAVEEALNSQEDFKSNFIGLKTPLKWWREHWHYAGYSSFDSGPAERTLSPMQIDSAKITAPVFALTGLKDVQSDPALCNVEKVKQWIPNAKSVECVVVEDVSHILRKQDSQASLLELQKEYVEQGKRNLDGRVVDRICEWVVQVVLEV